MENGDKKRQTFISLRASRRHNAAVMFGKKKVNTVNCEIQNLAFRDMTPPGTSKPAGLKNLLGLGLKFCPTPKPLKKSDLTTGFNDLVRSYRLKTYFLGKADNQYNKKLYVPTNWTPPKADEDAESIFLEIYSNIDKAYMNRIQKYNLNVAQRQTLKDLKANKNLIVVQADKNLGPVLMLTTKYLELCYNHLNSEVYRELKTSIEGIEGYLRRVITAFYKSLPYSKDNNIILDGIESKSLNLFYGLAKIHKPVLSIRPIVSNSNGILGGLSKFLDYHLQVYIRDLYTYLKDSDDLLELLQITPRNSDHDVFTYDVVSMYTSIDTETAVTIIEEFLPRTRLSQLLLKGIRLIMKNNFFTFDGKIWLQNNGTAMGTAVAPTYAVLFLGIVELKAKPMFEKCWYINKRFIDDGFVIWSKTAQLPFTEYIKFLKDLSGLDFTTESHEKSATFLDLEISWSNNGYLTKTHHKELNLFLYVPGNSAHAPGVLKSIVFGRILKYWKQNSKETDFKHCCQQLFFHLQARGYSAGLLKPLFQTAFKMCRGLIERPTPPTQVFLKLPYDPNGPKRQELAEILRFKDVERHFNGLGIEKITLCYKKPANLKSLLCPSKRSSNPLHN